jgi:hypothetical protein
MINLKKNDNVADAVLEILQQEALKGNQHKIDANKNNKIDGEDFKILRGKKKVEEELKGGQKKIDKNNNNKIDGEDFKILRGEKKVEEEIDMDDRTKDTLVGREKTKQKDDVGPNSNAKVSKFKLKSEEAEQIDIEEGAKETAQKALNLADKLRKKDPEKSKMYRNLGIKASQRSNNPTGVKSGQPHGSGNKALRKQGIEPVPSSISSSKMRGYFEEVEQMDELSKDTLGSYLDKKKSEYMKGKTQSGSKENAKDIQNMGKAHDKMTLKKMKESFEEPILDELINEVMSKDASAGDWIHDFVHSDNPKFAGKSKAKRKEMALAAYYSKKNEEVVNEGLKDMAKKTFKALTGGSDKDHLDRLKKDMYGGSEVKYAAKTLVKHAKDPLGLKKEEAELEEGWDDMVKAAQEKVKSGPKPSGGSGKKEGSRYGGSKQKEKPEQEVKEAKDPTMDAGCGSAPNFATDATKPMQAAQTMAKKSLARMRSDMMAKSGK